MTRFLRIILRPRRERVHAGPIFFLPNDVVSLLRGKRDDRAHDVNINGFVLG